MIPAVSVNTGSPTHAREANHPSPALPGAGAYGVGTGGWSQYPGRWVALDFSSLAVTHPPSCLHLWRQLPTRAESRWAGALQEEWSRVAMAIRPLETLTSQTQRTIKWLHRGPLAPLHIQASRSLPRHLCSGSFPLKYLSLSWSCSWP